MSPLRICIFVFALVLGLVLNFLYLRPMLMATPIDYAQFHFAGKLVAEGKVSQIYDRAAYAPLEAVVRAEHGKLSLCHFFNRPAYGALLWWPLSFFSYKGGMILMTELNLLLWAFLVWKLPVWLDAPRDLRIWLLSFFPFLSSVALAQDTLAITAVIAYSCCVLLKRREILAGGLLALCLVKPHLVVLLPVFLIRERKWKALASFAATGTVLGLLSLALVGVSGIEQWLDLLKAPTTDYSPSTMGNLRAIGMNFGMPLAFGLGALTVASAALVLARGSFFERLSTVLALSLLLSPHTYWQDYSLLAILALSTRSVAIRYLLLLPWCFFTPTIDMWPMTLAIIGSLSWMAANLVWKGRTAMVTERDAMQSAWS